MKGARKAGLATAPLRCGQAGFTLVEILVVITIIGMIMAIVGPRVLNYLAESKVKAAKIQIASFESALDLYYLDTSRYPASSEGLAALVQRPSNSAVWSGPYLKGGVVPKDPWGHPYVYRAPVERAPYEILSYGADGQEGGAGTAADVSSLDSGTQSDALQSGTESNALR
jgi:general secretion pathway protein G